ncbi:MAG TPA: BadF/BadG/BcrA/BcrD ATPase family protein, partial [Thermoanaerobaculia bacterium]
MTSNSKYFLGVDGGASKTAALVIDSDGEALGRGIAGPSNHLRVGIETATRNIERAVNIALVEAGMAIRQVEYAYCGIAGADHPAHRQRVIDSLRIFFPKGNFIVDNDARIALTGAVGFGSGIVIISGTGSVAFGRNAKGQEARAGGWGPTIGDEGSGYALGRDGLSAIVRAHDGRGRPTKMTELLCYDYDMCSPEDLPRFVYATTTHADDIARYGKLVIEAARHDDEVALEILQRAGRELAECVLAVARRLEITGTVFPVAYVGGVFNAEDLLLGPMR